MKLSEVKYQRPDIDQFILDIKSDINALKQVNSFEDFNAIFLKINQSLRILGGAHSLVEVRFSQNTKDEFFKKEKEFFDNESPKIQQVTVSFKDIVLTSKFRKELELEYGKQYFDMAELDSKLINNSVIEMLQKENQVSSEYQILMAQINIEFEGKTYNMSAMSPLLESIDREYRKKASKALYSEMLKIQPQLDSIYDELVKIRTNIAVTLGYPNFVQMGYDRMGRTCYNPKDIEKYRSFVLKYVTPKGKLIKEKLQKMQQLDAVFHYDTLIFSDGNPTPKTSPEKMIADAQIMYNELSPETGVFFKSMQDKEMLDLLNRENKSPGGYCTYIDAVKSPFIFSNFNGTSHDVDVLTHEAGHAFQCYCSMHFPLSEYLFPTSESAEIHSMSMEFFAWKWVDKFFLQDTEKYKLGHLIKSFLFLPYGVTVDEFQQKVFETPTLTPKERRDLWLEIDSIYEPWIKVDNEPFLENGGKWQRQSHIYSMPFYYIDYTLAQLCAFQFYKKMNENMPNAWKDYYELCQKGGSLNFLELLNISNLSSPFDEKGFKETIDYIFNEIEHLFDKFNNKSLEA